jgi:3D (Asp-Asp-Asp) domain-containing protein
VSDGRGIVSDDRWRFILVVAAALVTPACRRSPEFHDAAPRGTAGAARGTFALTYYWMETQPAGDDAAVALYTRACEPVATVSAAFAKDLTLAGTARLVDGRVLGVTGDCECKRSPCVRVLPPDQPWGVGLDNRPLVPFVSLAIDRDVIPLGTHLYIEELDGALLPGLMLSFHDGCVVADDTGDRMKGNRLDWFVGRHEAYAVLDARLHLTKVTVFDGGARCPSR